MNLLDITPNRSFRFRTKELVRINDDSRVTYYTNSKIKFKTSVLKLILCDYSDA